jgi:EAL domain-containing protein (putative c-di-GMP-specific phosphodiesterase class I)
LDQLKSLGLQLCLTHFGAGYSCLSHLTEFPFDWITLDPSLVRRITGENRMKVVRAITQLAEELDLQVIAKGIETADQLALLQQLHGHFGQGPAISETLAADAVEAFLQEVAGDRREL